MKLKKVDKSITELNQHFNLSLTKKYICKKLHTGSVKGKATAKKEKEKKPERKDTKPGGMNRNLVPRANRNQNSALCVESFVQINAY